MMKWEMEILSPTSFLPNSSWLLGQNNSGNWNPKENKLFEDALAIFDKETPDRWQKVANMIPGKTVEDVMRHYKELEEDVSYIEAGLVPIPGYSSSSFTLEWANNRDFDGLKQTFCAGGKRSGARVSDQERKKGVPWTEDEHRLFLMGLKKYGKGDWRNISRNFVVSRTPTQVASHAQKYFIRLSSGGKDKRRSSIHDITTINLPENRPPSPSLPPALSTHHSSAAAIPDQFSVIHDSNQPNEASRVFNPVGSQTPGNFFMPTPHGINPYGRKFESQDLYRSPLHESMVGHHNMFFRWNPPNTTSTDE